jgi:hypothetical protein
MTVKIAPQKRFSRLSANIPILLFEAKRKEKFHSCVRLRRSTPKNFNSQAVGLPVQLTKTKKNKKKM